MVTQKEAVCLWEDNVGDSGRAPTDVELHTFALAIEEKARKPFVKLHKKMKREEYANRSQARNNILSPYWHDFYNEVADEYRHIAKILKNRLDAKN